MKPAVHLPRRLVWIVLVIASSTIANSATSFADVPDYLSRPSAGINFAGPKDWSTELPLIDVMKLSRAWISQRHGAGWGKGPKLELDKHGHVQRLEPGCYAETPICNIAGGHYPSGRYTFVFEGKGRFEAHGAGKFVETTEHGGVIDVDSSKAPIYLRLIEVDPSDPPHNIRLMLPGSENASDGNPWRPEFIRRWSGMRVFRTMDWQHTNGSEIQTVDDFPSAEDVNFTTHGFPLTYIADFANRTRMDPWICVPHLADDRAVRHMATVMHETLDTDRRLIVEYSNEVWNGQFAQCRYAKQRGVELGLSTVPHEAGWKFTAQRSHEIFEIFESVFGGSERLVRIVPSQSANPYVAKKILEHFRTLGTADALAIAPYVSMNVKPENAPEHIAMGAEGVLEKALTESLPKTLQNIAANAELASASGLALVAYEGGQHFVGVGAANRNEALTRVLTTANADSKMQVLYERYLAGWNRHGGTLFCHFSSTGAWGRYGSWGLTQYADDPPESSPKFRGLMTWMQSLQTR